MGSSTELSFHERRRKEDERMDRKKVEEAILANTKGGKIPCASCFKIAEDLGIAKQEIGEILNQMKIKIGYCQLGCFQ